MALDAIGRGMDRLQEINIKIHKSHLTYLQTDDSPSKIQKRLKLEGFIKEYLCLVPNESKYVFQETAHILHRSASTLNDFSGYRACEAWSAISMYASNLLAQPWRKEYRTLRTYSGYYKHEIEANLIGAELMFELMGYKHTGLGTLTLEGPIDPDRVSSVSRDAIVAFVECQILKQIWEAISKNFKISWLEVLEFRENQVGTPDTAIRALTHRFYERLHQNRSKADVYRDYHHQTILDQVPPTTVPYHIIPNNFNGPVTIKPDYCYPEENYRYFQPYCLPQAPNRFYGGLPAEPYYNPLYATRLPTERLIEIEPPLSVVNFDKPIYRKSHREEEIDHSRRNPEDDYSRVERRPMKTSTSLDSAPNDSWDYVYRSLDNVRYSKDVGEREDILKKREKIKREKHSSFETEEKTSKDKKRFSKGFSEDNCFKKKGSVDLLDLDLRDSSGQSEERMSIQEKIRKFSQGQPKNYQKVVESVKNLTIGSKEERKGRDDKWDCSTCTYLNSADRDICEMCNKSRRKGNEDKPLASGGKECPKCTLVNEKDADKCEACFTSLKDSPTYI
ncbi:uncharacterized protein LOC107039657 [Diachasma alloeum]|uniref:uncharacterized protein LOC107039657 n=1 Tax=Diachasma alloeum TaxID=454923 RepID=UPI0007383889|nr:uncharacterized protein LOC107039657 [Diachasma alloeum]